MVGSSQELRIGLIAFAAVIERSGGECPLHVWMTSKEIDPSLISTRAGVEPLR